MVSNGMFDFLIRTDFFFGYRPQLYHGRRKRFQSVVGGGFCYVYLFVLLIWSTFLTIEYWKNETTGLNKNFEYIDYHSHEDDERLNEISHFKPNDKEMGIDFNMAFGFIKTNMPKSIGRWRV